ncbi:MAG: hypothetical protein NTY61_02035, partial [Candidatus Parcubacteria bacterium]|nr:hypothetical protein [Candidatus Parcubacteria bacterium]
MDNLNLNNLTDKDQNNCPNQPDQNQLNSQPKEKLIISKIIHDQAVRRGLTCESHYWFFNLYFSHYVKHETALFQREMFTLSEDEKIKVLMIAAFRGSAKSSIMTLSYPIWAIMGKPQKKFVIIVSQTQEQAKQHLKNIKDELERNEILRKDLGPFQEEDREWRSYSLIIPKYNAKIMAASTEQSIRGFRHGAIRPDLIICDDIENSDSVRMRESRQKTYGWFNSEILPLGDENTKIIIVGNLLHEDSLVMRLKEKIDLESENDESVKQRYQYRWYPLIDDKNQILWPGKYPNIEAVNDEKRLHDDSTWYREYLLRIISGKERVIHPEWIQYYDQLPDNKKSPRHRHTLIGIDLAISKSDNADYTAMVSAAVYGYQEKMRIYILPNPVNEKLDFPETIEKIKIINNIP